MKTRAAVLWEPMQPWQIEEIEVDAPRQGELLVEMKACGLCHSDEHVRSGDVPVPHFPFVGGHEGAGEVLEVGPGVTSVAPGDHVALSFIPSCGRCRWCAGGQSYVCDEGSKLFDTGMITDGRIAHRCKGQDVARFSQLGAFSEVQLLGEQSVVKVDPAIPWHAVALVSCGVTTGFGSAVTRAGTRPGDTVAVVGVGGVGIGAVQGARIAGASRIIAIDPIESRREGARAFGATDVYSSLLDAMGPIAEITAGVMCERVILTPGVMRGADIDLAVGVTAKAGTCVVTGAASFAETTITLNLFLFTMMNKELKGCLFGSGNPRADIPRLLNLYRRGELKLDEMVSRTYPLDQINEAYDDQEAGRILRGMISFAR